MTNDQTSRADLGVDKPDVRALRTFALIGVPSGWLFLGIPVALGLPVEPFVLLTLLFGLVLPAVVLTRRDPGGSVRALLGDSFRPARPAWPMVPALLMIPGFSWLIARPLGGAETLDRELLVALLVDVGSSLLIVNIWEEMAWMGFFQRRAMARWGQVPGSLVTAALFVGIHLPLAFVDVDTGQRLATNLAVLVGSSIGLRLLLAFTDIITMRSILTVAVVHAAWNATGELLDADHDWVRYVVTISLGLLSVTTSAMRDRRHRSSDTAA
jgi:membrane protease YdiL (CAAX protease family)